MVHIDTRQLTCDELWNYLLKNAALRKKIFDTLSEIAVNKSVTCAGVPEYWANKKKVISDYFGDLGLGVVGLSYRPYGIKVLCKDSKFLIYYKTSGGCTSLSAKKVTR